ncbi:MAG: hypothetical protein B6245_11325 [Desulfobacteraceae bacterium 4572_88]|nr:MAG: hypothetical protein B6245_11325 [Desulfobacteraceae bacterium 4572_88]RLC08070.1 MAG: type VI secretion protein [Deltaproteobacteria bacterium]
MFANCQMGGMSFAFPDVCLTMIGPVPVPIPYPNMGMWMMGVPPYPKVLLCGMPAHNMGTMVPMTIGDLPGFAGVMSGTVMMMGRVLIPSFGVFYGPMPAIKMTSMTMQNLINCFGMILVPAQFKVLVMK